MDEKNLKSLGDIVKVDRALARLGENNKLTKTLTKEEFLGMVNNGIQPMATTGLWNPQVSELAKGSWDAGSFRLNIHNKNGALVAENAEYTDGSNPTKRNKRRRVMFHVGKRLLSEGNGYRVEAAIETGMFNPNEIADTTSNELQAHNLWKDRKYFELLGDYVKGNFKTIARDENDVEKSYDSVIAELVKLTGQLKDGFDFAGKSYLGEHPTIDEGSVVVIGTHSELTPLIVQYLIAKGVSSDKAVEDFKNGTSTKVKIGNLTFKAVPLASMTGRTDKKLLVGPTADAKYAEVRFFIQTTGKFSPVGGKFKSIVDTGELNAQFGDFYIQSRLYQATTGTDFDNDNGEIYENHVFAITAEEPATVAVQGQNPVPADMVEVEADEGE